MPDTDIGNAVASDLTNVMVDYSVTPESLDGASGVGETTWQLMQAKNRSAE